jgi:hypothetical protein
VASYPQTLRAVAQKEQSNWEVGLALTREIRVTAGGQVRAGEFVRCQEWLASQGYERSASWLAEMRKVAIRRPTAHSRRFKVGFKLYQVAISASSNDKQVDVWLAEAEAKKLTLRQFNVLVTGKEWADSSSEKLKAAARDNPETIVEVLRANPDIVAEAAKTPEVAAAIVANSDSELAVLQAQGNRDRRHGNNRLESAEPLEPFARALVRLNLLALRQDAERMQKVAVRDFSGSYVWRGREKEKVLAELDAVAEIVGNVRAVLTAEFTDAELAQFLNT